MNGFTVIAACIGCLLALYLWTATKQRWVPTLRSRSQQSPPVYGLLSFPFFWR